jgi:hypothetical protein
VFNISTCSSDAKCVLQHRVHSVTPVVDTP